MKKVFSIALIGISMFASAQISLAGKANLIFPTGSTTVQYDITLPDGFYTVADINSYIQQICVDNGVWIKSQN